MRASLAWGKAVKEVIKHVFQLIRWNIRPTWNRRQEEQAHTIFYPRLKRLKKKHRLITCVLPVLYSVDKEQPHTLYSFARLIDSTFLLQQRIYRRRARRVYGLDIILYPIEVVVVSSSCIQVVRAVWEKQIPRWKERIRVVWILGEFWTLTYTRGEPERERETCGL
jgi:hypothetical protein